MRALSVDALPQLGGDERFWWEVSDSSEDVCIRVVFIYEMWIVHEVSLVVSADSGHERIVVVAPDVQYDDHAASPLLRDEHRLVEIVQLDAQRVHGAPATYARIDAVRVSAVHIRVNLSSESRWE